MDKTAAEHPGEFVHGTGGYLAAYLPIKEEIPIYRENNFTPGGWVSAVDARLKKSMDLAIINNGEVVYD